MGLERTRVKGRRDGPTFVSKPHHIFRPDFRNNKPSPASVLSHKAAHMLDNLLSQFNGMNNGDFSAAPKIMMLYGWKSSSSINDALVELLAHGFIEQTRLGGRNKCSLYAVTWLPINECKGKLDVNETRIASNLWKPENRCKIDKRHIDKWEQKQQKKLKSVVAIETNVIAIRTSQEK